MRRLEESTTYLNLTWKCSTSFSRVVGKQKLLPARKKLEALRTFYRFVHESGWIATNPAILIKPPKVEDPPTLPFTQDEIQRVLKACDVYPREGHPNKLYGKRLKALVLLLHYSGLRITDAVTLSKHRIEDGILKLRTAKTGAHVRIPLPPSANDALNDLHAPDYYFWSGTSTKKSCVGDYRRAFKKLYVLAKVNNGHAIVGAIPSLLNFCYRECRRTGFHSSRPSVRERHGKALCPWVEARQEQLEAGVRPTFEADKMAYS